MKNLKLFIAILIVSVATLAHGQNTPNKVNQLKINLSDDGKNYFRFTFLNQVWLRYTDANPGSTLYSYSQNKVFDISIGRKRIQMYGKLNSRTFVYCQFGMNNFNHASKQYFGAFFLDAISEFQVHEKYLSFGAGFSGWSGLSRYASSPSGTILATDGPLYQEATYRKGMIQLQYQIAI